MLDRLEHEIERRGTGLRYAGVQHTYRSWLLRNLGDPAAEELALHRARAGQGRRRSWPSATSTWPTACSAPATSRAPPTGWRSRETESGTRWFHNKWRFDQRRGLLLARLALAEQDAASALDAADPVAERRRGAR